MYWMIGYVIIGIILLITIVKWDKKKNFAIYNYTFQMIAIIIICIFAWPIVGSVWIYRESGLFKNVKPL